MLAIIMFFLLGQAVNPGTTYWVFFWILVAWKGIELISKIYKAGEVRIP